MRLAVLAVSVLAILSARPAAAQFSVAPAQLALGGADTAATEVLTVRNEGPEPLQLRFYGGDFEQLPNGDHRFLALGEHARSCADRLRIFPEGTVLAPGEVQEVRLTLEPGVRACWSLVFAEAASSATGQVQVSQRIAVKTFGLAPGLRSEGEVGEVLVAGTAAGRTVLVEFRNIGELPLRPFGRVELRDLTGALHGTIAIEPFTVLPGAPRRVSVPLPTSLPAGSYLAVPILDFGADYLVGGQATFEVE